MVLVFLSFFLGSSLFACPANYVGVVGNDQYAIGMVQSGSQIHYLRIGDRICSGIVRTIKRGSIVIDLHGRRQIAIKPTGTVSEKPSHRETLEPTGDPAIDQLIAEGKRAVEAGEITAAELEQMVQEEKAAIKESQQLEEEFRSRKNLAP